MYMYVFLCVYVCMCVEREFIDCVCIPLRDYSCAYVACVFVCDILLVVVEKEFEIETITQATCKFAKQLYNFTVRAVVCIHL